MSGRDENPNIKGKEIFIITAGEYSDYFIVAVFSELELAKEFLLAYNQDKTYGAAHMEEWVMDLPPKQWYKTVVVINKIGNISMVETDMSWDLNQIPEELPVFYRKHWKDPESEIFLRVAVATNDHERAIKKTNEIRGICLAHELWGDTESLRAILRR